jgi:glycosyltransferase involved in cell wall biosynthesis
MLEAMVLERAIIASRSGAMPEVLRDRVDGLLVEPISSAEIGAALVERLEKPEPRRTLGKAVGETARGLTPGREVREWTEVYDIVRAMP